MVFFPFSFCIVLIRPAQDSYESLFSSGETGLSKNVVDNAKDHVQSTRAENDIRNAQKSVYS